MNEIETYQYETAPVAQPSFLRFGIGFSLIFTALFFHVIHWGGDALAIIPLRAASISGFASEDSYRSLLAICEARQKPDCMVEAYTGLIRSNPQNMNLYIDLGDLQRHLGRHGEALRSYDTYLQLDGPSTALAHYGRARSLAALGDRDGAQEAFEAALRARPDVIQVTVTEAYLDFLMQNGEFAQAKQVIHEARQRGRSNDFFARQDAEITRNLATH